MPAMQDRLAYRLCHDYLAFANDEPPFNACDAIALSQLAVGPASSLMDDYVSAFDAVAEALQLRQAEAAFELLTMKWVPDLHLLLGLDMLEVAALWNLIQLRKAAMSTLRFDSGALFGDHWLRSDPYRERSYQPSLQAVQAWREASDAHITGGVTLVDQALCGMLGWDTASTVTLRALRSQFGYPDPGLARVKSLDSF